MKRRLLLATAAALLATPAFAQTKWDMPAAYPATNYPPPALRLAYYYCAKLFQLLGSF